MMPSNAETVLVGPCSRTHCTGGVALFCPGCGTQINSIDQFCPNCGRPQTPAAVLPRTSVAVDWSPPANIEAHPGRWISEGWQLVFGDLGNYLLVSLLFTVLNSVPLIQGALIAGFHVFTMKKVTGRNAEAADLFRGFNFFVPTLVASLLIGLFTFVGFLFLVIPGLVIAAMYKFTYLFIVDKRMDFWPAMQASHSVVKNDYFGFTMFLILALLVNVIGFLCFFVGLFITMPVTFAAITVAYKEIVGFEQATLDAL
jgi:hypothetical protein